ncbi:MAG: hypothetical protein HS104_36355 [Polyangiaceae bacterium]|nr:hypothetical protein [Polyangiaceae bacterium]MCL4750274.1 hypothetical protein [Myxococcales bacterium]
MSPLFRGAALCLLAAACASKPPPPPVIETQEAQVGPKKSASETPDETRPTPAVAQSPGGPAPAPTPLAGAETGPSAAPQVKLLEPGAEPRRALRHSFGKGKQLLGMKAKTRVKGANLPLPTISLSAPMEAQIVEVNKAGEARFKFQAGPFKSGTGAGGGVAGALGSLMGGGGGAPEKIAGWGWLTNRGVMKEFHVEEGATDGDAPVETGDPFPEEAVGVGASWEVTSVVQEKDGPVQQVSVYELTKLDKKAAHTKLTRTQTPVGQGDGAAVAKSSGELVFRFGEVYPTGRLEMTRNMSLALPGLEGSSIQLASEVVISKR